MPFSSTKNRSCGIINKLVPRAHASFDFRTSAFTAHAYYGYMASRDKIDADAFLKDIQYALEKLGKLKFGFERTVELKFKSKRRVGSGNELVDYSRALSLGADQKARGLWERDCSNGIPVFNKDLDLK